jgi:hypothetical protein
LNGRYELLRPLGQGGMAKVYLARDGLLGRDVALKVMREEYAEDGEFVERFEREARAAASLSHPNVVQIHDRGCSEDGRYYIVMEYVPGGTLKERVRAEGPVRSEEAAGLAAQIAGALGAAHGRGVVHRDVKSQNVLLAEGGRAKVADFGIARAASAASISRSSLILGTPNYMSPEQAEGKPVGPASDLYSLGVVLYEMLTGRMPFEAETPVAVSMKHVNEPAPSPREVNPDVPEAIEAITLRLLAKDPNERYASAEELIEDLRRASAGAPVVGAVMAAPLTAPPTDAPTVPLPARAAGSSLRRKAPLALASLAVVLGMGGGFYLWQGSEGPGIAGFLEGVPEEARQALDDASRALGSIGVVVAEAAEAPDAEVPDVLGLSAEEAEARLAEAGFESERRPRESSEEDAGKVLEQSVDGGKEVEEGSILLLAVGTGLQEEEGAAPEPAYGEEQYQVELAPEPAAEQPSPAGVRPQYEEPAAQAPEPTPAEEPAPAPEGPYYEAPAQYEGPAPAPSPVAEEEPALAPEQPYYEEPVYEEPVAPAPAPAPSPVAEEEPASAPEQPYYEEPVYEEPVAPAPEPEATQPAPGAEQPSYEEAPQEDSGGRSDDGGGDGHDGGGR